MLTKREKSGSPEPKDHYTEPVQSKIIGVTDEPRW